jgi:hypothetical protein
VRSGDAQYTMLERFPKLDVADPESGGSSRIRNKFVMRLCLDAFCAFSEFVESITCDLSIAP